MNLGLKMLRDLFSSEKIRLAYATLDAKVIGYAILLQCDVPSLGIVSWLTQLVVHSDHRNKGVSKKLVATMWGFSNHAAWGVLTANPYAVRALESTTFRRCNPEIIFAYKEKLKAMGLKHISYIAEDMDLVVTTLESRLNTRFFVDHTEVPQMLETVTKSHAPWLLGTLDEGWEWFAFTFNDQAPMMLSLDNLESLLDASNQVAMDAYSRMRLDHNHKWTKHTPHEVDFIFGACKLEPNSKVLDLGCGVGRHAISLANKGVDVVGVDYLENLISRAKEKAKDSKLNNIEFVEWDCRNFNSGTQFDAVICLYDVIGSFPEEADNFAILRTIRDNLKCGGHALISVMNYELTEKIAKRTFNLLENYQELFLLPPSHTMEKSGNVFDPDYYLLDTKTRIAYRREQFEAGSSIPVELIVRDKRYSRKEIAELCGLAGLHVDWVRCVKLGDWNTDLNSTDKNAKEILVCCRRLD